MSYEHSLSIYYNTKTNGNYQMESSWWKFPTETQLRGCTITKGTYRKGNPRRVFPDSFNTFKRKGQIFNKLADLKERSKETG